MILATPLAADWPAGVDVVVVGEVHDNPAHHLYQAEVVRELQPAALVFEMLSPAQAAAIATMDRSDEAALRDALDWDNSGWPDFSMYYPIFAATDAAIYGAALPRDDIRAAMTQGAAEIFGEQAAQYGLTALTQADIDALSGEMQEVHCNMLPEEMMAGMVEAQHLRDAHFARVTVEALESQGKPVVVITGNGHARMDRGMTARLRQAQPDLLVWAIGQIEEGGETDNQPFDAIRVTDRVEREDPCLSLR